MVATADEMHDLQLVAILDDHLVERRARHHFQVALHRQLGGHQPQLLGQLGDGQAGGHSPVLAVDGDGDGAVGMGHESLCGAQPHPFHSG